MALARGRGMAVTDDGSLAKRLRALREDAGFSQEELAERAGLSTHAISALERGTRTRPTRTRSARWRRAGARRGRARRA